MHAMMRAHGFTLVEVLVALVVSGVVLLGARQLLAGVGDSATRIGAAAARADRDANAERVLRELVERLEVGTDQAAPFGGDESAVEFSTWCDTPAGWLERCRVRLGFERRFERGAAALALEARTSLGDTLVLRDGVHAGALRYLATAAHGGQWIRVWGTGITAPVGIGAIVDGDTLILRIGERG